MASISSEDNLTGTSYTAFFDLDDTLINANSGKLLVKLAYNRNKLSGPWLIKALWFSVLHKAGLKDPEKVVADMVAWIAGVPLKSLEILSAELFENHLLKSITPPARREISFHRKQNAKMVILSSSLSPVCKAVSEYLEMDGYLCTDLEVRDGFFTGHTNGPICYGNEKVNRLLEYCEKNNTLPGEAWYYGDALADLPVLKIVGHPVCVNPDKKLLKAAVRNGWEIKYWD